MFLTLCRARFSMMCCIVGLFLMGRRGFGRVSVKGLRRVPRPPTRMRAVEMGLDVSIIIG